MSVRAIKRSTHTTFLLTSLSHIHTRIRPSRINTDNSLRESSLFIGFHHATHNINSRVYQWRVRAIILILFQLPMKKCQKMKMYRLFLVCVCVRIRNVAMRIIDVRSRKIGFKYRISLAEKTNSDTHFGKVRDISIFKTDIFRMCANFHRWNRNWYKLLLWHCLFAFRIPKRTQPSPSSHSRRNIYWMEIDSKFIRTKQSPHEKRSHRIFLFFDCCRLLRAEAVEREPPDAVSNGVRGRLFYIIIIHWSSNGVRSVVVTFVSRTRERRERAFPESKSTGNGVADDAVCWCRFFLLCAPNDVCIVDNMISWLVGGGGSLCMCKIPSGNCCVEQMNGKCHTFVLWNAYVAYVCRTQRSDNN